MVLPASPLSLVSTHGHCSCSPTYTVHCHQHDLLKAGSRSFGNLQSLRRDSLSSCLSDGGKQKGQCLLSGSLLGNTAFKIALLSQDAAW